MAQYPKIESIGSIGSIILAILEVQVGTQFSSRAVPPPPFQHELGSRAGSGGCNGFEVEYIDPKHSHAAWMFVVFNLAASMHPCIYMHVDCARSKRLEPAHTGGDELGRIIPRVIP